MSEILPRFSIPVSLQSPTFEKEQAHVNSKTNREAPMSGVFYVYAMSPYCIYAYTLSLCLSYCLI